VAPPQCRAQHDGADRRVSAKYDYADGSSSRRLHLHVEEASDIVQFTDNKVNRFS